MRNMSKKTWKIRVRNHMTEMQKLDSMLKKLKVPHTYDCHFLNVYHEGDEQIIVYDSEGRKLCDAICCVGSYGSDQGLVEVMGPAIIGHCNEVKGWLTAREVTKMWRWRKYAAKNR